MDNNFKYFLACAYLNGGITPEEAVMLSYARGIGFIKSKAATVQGQMAAVGLSHEEIANILPDGIFVACDNSSQSVTISGPKEITDTFVKHLQLKGIFAKKVDSCGVPLHTKYIDTAAKHSLEFFKTILANPQPRSNRWISTSVQQYQEKFEWSKYNSAEYHYNNFCNVVLFRQALQQIPDNAIVIEVSPHGLLQAILKRELKATTINIPLLSKRVEDNEQYFLSSIGK